MVVRPADAHAASAALGHGAGAAPPEAAPGAPSESRAGATTEMIYLLGRPTLRRFVRWASHSVVRHGSRGSLVDQWLAARAHLRRLEIGEAGLADQPPIVRPGPEYEPLLIELLRDPLIRHGFNTVPTEIAFVELDRLVVFQRHIDRTFVAELKRRLGPAPGGAEVFRACLPTGRPTPPVAWSRSGRDTFVFMSPSNDLRFLGTMPIEPGHITGHAPRGATVRVVGLGVGFGSNFMNVIHAENRLILNNGSHRACALRELGVTHVPCIVQHAGTRDELDLIASKSVRRSPDEYLRHPRPPLLKDYFDPGLRTLVTVRRMLRQVTVRFQVAEKLVPAP